MQTMLVWVLASLVYSVPALAQQVLKVAVTEGSKQYQPALAALYKEAGLTPEFVVFPSERALRSVESGDVDADLGRVTGGTAGYQNVIELSESLSEIGLIAIVRNDSGISRLSIPDLKGRTVATVRGTKMAEGTLAKVGVEPILVNSAQQMYQMLEAGRFEIALTTSTAMPGSDVLAHAKVLPPLLTARAVHVLNKKWSALAPKLDAALRAMKADGRWAKLVPAS